jgi:hypothetical protein
VSQRSQDALERLSDGPIYTVYLDAGSFSWLVEIIEAKSRSQIWLKGYQRLVKRTMLAFQESEKALNPSPTDETRKRVVPRATRKPARKSGKR